jgi:hypothetical protein
MSVCVAVTARHLSNFQIVPKPRWKCRTACSSCAVSCAIRQLGVCTSNKSMREAYSGQRQSHHSSDTVISAACTQLRGARRCQHNARATRARGESPDSPLRGSWAADAALQRPATAPAAGTAAAAPYLGGTGRIFAPAGGNIYTPENPKVEKQLQPAALLALLYKDHVLVHEAVCW